MADILIHDGIVVPVDGTNRVIEKGYVAIDGNRISAVGKMEDLGHEKMSDVMIDARGKAVLPGFVNAHTHLATECFRGIVEKLPGIHFTFLVKNYLDDRHICDLSLLGCLELIRFGTTCTGDNYQRSRLIARAIADSGLRGVVSEQISQADLKGSYPAIYTYEPEEAERQIRANEELIREWNGAEGGRITCAFGPHAPDTLTQELLMEIRTKAEEQDVGVMIHLAQSQRELEIMRLRHRMTSVEYLERTGILGPRTLAAHCVHLTQKDMEIMRETGAHIAHCPSVFIKRGRPTPLIPWLKGGIRNIGLGTDNILHDPFESMRFSNFLALQYVHQIEPDSLHLVPSAHETLEMATVGSAKALGLHDEVGSLEPGKKADAIIVDLKKPHLVPMLDVVTNLVHYANGNDVETTIIDGELVMHQREIRTVDESKVLMDGQRASEEVWGAFNARNRQFPDVADKFKLFT